MPCMQIYSLTQLDLIRNLLYIKSSIAHYAQQEREIARNDWHI